MLMGGRDLRAHVFQHVDADCRGEIGVAAFEIEGLKSNLPFFTELLADEEFVSGVYDTGLIDRMRAPKPSA
jgi:acetyl/propionyl-CoA carboxylase alpha subunit